ncbi:aminotransferase class I/II-fold pyridoxal phosphate-dependent enzyme [Pendulispora brunnea]|uniref:Aminotransferase class I/II-fold pyridoxal phosphate-dependent enzyme n=1 Tax=Pendulispora brunnea TaxID=2905690 RepID=A0ABZ2KM54_9BACT
MQNACIDFASALYLGFRHASAELEAWPELTTGAPAILREPPGAAAVARSIAQLAGAEHAAVFPSTLHLFWDLFQHAGGPNDLVVYDDGIYPIMQWGIEMAGLRRGVSRRRFAHHDPGALARLLRDHPCAGRLWIAADGFCPGCGRAAPLAQYAEMARAHGGVLLVEDTQAFGLLGPGGGGSLLAQGIRGADTVMVASLAKAFGAPLCVVAGARERILRLQRQSETRVYASPPSAASLAAAKAACDTNAREGDRLRHRLARRVSHFRACAAAWGVAASSAEYAFPVQRCWLDDRQQARRLYEELARRGVHAVPQQSRCGARTSITFLLRADHSFEDIEYGLTTFTRVLRTCRRLTSGERRPW